MSVLSTMSAVCLATAALLPAVPWIAPPLARIAASPWQKRASAGKVAEIVIALLDDLGAWRRTGSGISEHVPTGIKIWHSDCEALIRIEYDQTAVTLNRYWRHKLYVAVAEHVSRAQAAAIERATTNIASNVVAMFGRDAA